MPWRVGLLSGLMIACAAVRLPYPRQPQRHFGAASDYSTGLALADINGDGFEDLIVANGNDRARRPVVVYYNDGQGYFGESPDWESSDSGYHTGVAVGDIDGNGFNDVAVTLGPGPDASEQGYVKVYFNEGGRLAGLPGFTSEDRYSALGCALGDADGDGDLDLAVAPLFERARPEEPPRPSAARLYRNEGGRLSPRPTWTSSDTFIGASVRFADLNQDGLMDLVVSAPGIPVYLGTLTDGAVSLSRTPLWWADARIHMPWSLDTGAFDAASGGTAPGVVVAYNDFFPPLTGEHTADALAAQDSCASVSRTRFVLYPSAGDAPGWSSACPGWGSHVVLADLDGDGRLDLLTGSLGPSTRNGMGAPVRIHMGSGSTFSATPAWSSSTEQVVQRLAVADLGHESLAAASPPETFTFSRPRAMVTLSRPIIARLTRVTRDGVVQRPGDYVTVPGGNWLSFAKLLQPGETVSVHYLYPRQLDISVTNFGARSDIFYYAPARASGR
jgi:hypothetical protein